MTQSAVGTEDASAARNTAATRSHWDWCPACWCARALTATDRCEKYENSNSQAGGREQRASAHARVWIRWSRARALTATGGGEKHQTVRRPRAVSERPCARLNTIIACTVVVAHREKRHKFAFEISSPLVSNLIPATSFIPAIIKNTLEIRRYCIKPYPRDKWYSAHQRLSGPPHTLVLSWPS
jgi:hypothetical protein